MKIAHLSDSPGMRCQVHGMGLANAQLCAAIRVNDYYEQLVINEKQIRDLKDLGKLAIVDGDLNVSSEPGLGYEIDWAHVERVAAASA
jgi:L-alanine-DL-glutamate epimerase-like enolase superfamily enzyme